jgi:hypothetical protein
MGRNNKEDSAYTQPTIAGLEAPQPEETELDNCLVLSRPEYKDTGKKQEWACAIHAQPSIFQPDTDAVFLASASHDLAISARRKSLKPGDRVVLTGIVNSQTIVFSNGDTQTVNRIALKKAPHMLTKEKRISTTIFEQNQHR